MCWVKAKNTCEAALEDVSKQMMFIPRPKLEVRRSEVAYRTLHFQTSKLMLLSKQPLNFEVHYSLS